MAKPAYTIIPHDAIGSAARRTIAHQLKSLLDQIDGAKAGEVEPIHQLRVATRRLRATLRLFAPYIRAIKPRAASQQLRWLANQAGQVRNLDIIEALARNRAEKLTDQMSAALGPLWEEIHAQRAHHAAHLAAALNSVRCKRVVKVFSSTIPITPSADAPFSSAAYDLVWPLLDSMLLAGTKMENDPAPPTIHRLRVRAKRARYALETMREMDKKRVGAVLDRFAELQDCLGRYHDAAVAAQWIEDWVRSRHMPAESVFAAGALAELVHRRERKLAHRAIARWKDFIKANPERELIRVLRKSRTASEVPVQ